jgi:hypothetical protein
MATSTILNFSESLRMSSPNCPSGSPLSGKKKGEEKRRRKKDKT